MNTLPPIQHIDRIFIAPDARSLAAYKAVMKEGKMDKRVERLASLFAATTDEFSFAFWSDDTEGMGVRVILKTGYDNVYSKVDFSTVSYASYLKLSGDLTGQPIRGSGILLVTELIKALPAVKTPVTIDMHIRSFDFSLHYDSTTPHCYTIGVFAQ